MDETWHQSFVAFSVFKGKYDNDANPDNNGEEIIFGDYREKDLAKWIRKQQWNPSSLSSEQVLALKHVGFLTFPQVRNS